MHADLLLLDATVHTMDPRQPTAQAVAIAGEQILDVGSSAALLAYKGPGTRMFRANGRAIVPGFYDAHQHQVYLGLSLHQVDGRVNSLDELVKRTRERAAALPAGQWVEGVGYDDNNMIEHRHPSRWDLDSAAPNHPVFITRMCGHVMALNSLALRLAGISAETPDPSGGTIDRDPQTGEPTGVLREAAMERLRRVVPTPSITQLKSAILEAAESNLKLGITSVWEPSVEPDHVRAYRELEADGKLAVRVTMAHKKVLRNGTVVSIPEPFRGPWLSLVAIKLFQDGGIGARTAALSEPYVGDSGGCGISRWAQDELNALVREIQRAGLRVSVHAIGDAAIASVLSALEATTADATLTDPRHRIEHCGIVLPYLHPRLVKHGIIPVLQPIFLYNDGDTYMRNLGPARSRWLYPLKTCLELGLSAAASSDAPVVTERNPLLGMRAAMTRRTRAGQVVNEEEKVTFAQALRAYTLGAAYAGGEENEKGSLSPGKAADLVVLGADPAVIAPEELERIPVQMVVTGGRVRYESF